MPQICYLGPSFHFMRSRKSSCKKSTRLQSYKVQTIMVNQKFLDVNFYFLRNKSRPIHIYTSA